MRIVVTGATGNVGTSVLAALGRDPQVTEIVGLARRVPESLSLPKVRWRQADVTVTPLKPIFDGADAVVHLAWAIQPSHDEEAMEGVNVLGSQRVFGAAGQAGGRRGPGPRVLGRRLLAGAEGRGGRRVLAERRHRDLRADVPEPAIGPPELASLLHARRVPVPAKVLRAAASATWRAHLQPADAGWIDLALGVPLMDIGRARRELGWKPRKTSLEALGELLAGLRHGTGGPTPPLDPKAGGPLRAGELATGIGSRNRSPWDR
jgi:hypothetical protein